MLGAGWRPRGTRVAAGSGTAQMCHVSPPPPGPYRIADEDVDAGGSLPGHPQDLARRQPQQLGQLPGQLGCRQLFQLHLLVQPWGRFGDGAVSRDPPPQYCPPHRPTYLSIRPPHPRPHRRAPATRRGSTGAAGTCGGKEGSGGGRRIRPSTAEGPWKEGPRIPAGRPSPPARQRVAEADAVGGSADLDQVPAGELQQVGACGQGSSGGGSGSAPPPHPSPVLPAASPAKLAKIRA